MHAPECTCLGPERRLAMLGSRRAIRKKKRADWGTGALAQDQPR
jgi:hypothetical protein